MSSWICLCTWMNSMTMMTLHTHLSFGLSRHQISWQINYCLPIHTQHLFHTHLFFCCQGIRLARQIIAHKASMSMLFCRQIEDIVWLGKCSGIFFRDCFSWARNIRTIVLHIWAWARTIVNMIAWSWPPRERIKITQGSFFLFPLFPAFIVQCGVTFVTYI